MTLSARICLFGIALSVTGCALAPPHPNVEIDPKHRQLAAELASRLYVGMDEVEAKQIGHDIMSNHVTSIQSARSPTVLSVFYPLVPDLVEVAISFENPDLEDHPKDWRNGRLTEVVILKWNDAGVLEFKHEHLPLKRKNEAHEVPTTNASTTTNQPALRTD